MAIARPVTKTIISTTAFGIPVVDWINANTPTAWTNVTYTNGWNTYPGYQPLQYRKIGDMVYLRGFVQSPGGATSMGTLPAGFRPPLTLEFATAYYSGSRIVIAVSVSNNGMIAASDSSGVGSGLGVNFQFSTI